MKRNISGLHGRNVTFLKKFKPVSAYILKYTESGEYYALDKADGNLYKISAGSVMNADYEELEQYGIVVTEGNWRRYVEFDYRNPYFGKADAMELGKTVACAVCVLCLMISLVCVAFAVKPFPYQVYGVFILLGTVLIALNTLVYMFYFKTDKQRSDLSVYSVYDTIDYSPYNTSADADDKTYSPNVYRAMLIVAVAVAVSAVLHYKDGMFQYSVWCTAGTSFFVISLAVLAVLLKKGVRIVDIKWCVLAIIMITYLLTTLESNFWGKPIQLVLAVVSVIMFVKHNR